MVIDMEKNKKTDDKTDRKAKINKDLDKDLDQEKTEESPGENKKIVRCDPCLHCGSHCIYLDDEE